MWNRAISIALILVAASASGAEIERIWLTHQTNEPTHLVVNWETDGPGDSLVEYGSTPACEQRVRREESVLLHHVEIPLSRPGIYHYRVQSGGEQSETFRVKFYADDVLRVGVVADWQGKPSLGALLKEDIHLLLSAGDHVSNLHSSSPADAMGNTRPFSQLVAAYPELFRSVPFLPALGNHDREIRPRGSKPAAEPVYDIEATAFRTFFPLPDDGWKWRFDIPSFGVRFVALDLNHISDQGTTWQTCHPFGRDTEQFHWYQELSAKQDRRFVVTLYNEQHRQVRAQSGGEWGRMIQRGTAAISGFGYFAERAEVEGFPYFNTALGKGAEYPDPKSKFLASVPSYVLLTFRRDSDKMLVELKDLEGKALDQSEWTGRMVGDR